MRWEDLRAGALGFVAVIALYAPCAWSADRPTRHHLDLAQAFNSAPHCDDRVVLGQIVADFGPRYWPVGLVDLRGVHQARWNPWPPELTSPRWCAGWVVTTSRTDEAPMPIYYSILGIGFSYRIESCVVGLDHDWAYNPQCLRARP